MWIICLTLPFLSGILALQLDAAFPPFYPKNPSIKQQDSNYVFSIIKPLNVPRIFSISFFCAPVGICLLMLFLDHDWPHSLAAIWVLSFFGLIGGIVWWNVRCILKARVFGPLPYLENPITIRYPMLVFDGWTLGIPALIFFGPSFLLILG